MSGDTCQVRGCGRPVLDAFVCQACTDQLVEDLRKIITGHSAPEVQATVVDDRGRERLVPRAAGWIGRDLSSPFDHNAGLLADLVAAYSREARTGRGGGQTSDTMLVWHERAAELRRQLMATLVRYARLIADARSITLPGDVASTVTPLTLAGWLERHVEWLRHQQAGAAAVSDVHRLVAAITKVIDPLDDRQFIGLCTARPVPADGCSCACHAKMRQRPLCDQRTCQHKGAYCGTSLHAALTTTEMQCPTCRQVYEVATHRQWLLDALDPVLATATEIATALTSLELPVTPERIRQWKHRGRLEVRGYRPRRVDVDATDDAPGDPLYRLGDVKALRDAELAAAARREARKAG